MKKYYLCVKDKWKLSFFLSMAWFVLSIFFSQNWFNDLSKVVNHYFAAYIVATIAILPGFITAFFNVSLWLDNRPKKVRTDYDDPVSILISAFNEQDNIKNTIDSCLKQDYAGHVEIIVINDGSSDSTKNVLDLWFSDNPQIKIINLAVNIGKSGALNIALSRTKYDIVLTLDADSILHKHALKNIVSCFKESPKNTGAVAGTVLVKNSRQNFLTKVQEHDYFYGISATKRIQSLYGATSVAQGAFSLYLKAALIEIGGWKDYVGEDIVLTWTLIEKGYRVGHCEDAYCFTVVPSTLKALINQRTRWAMGLFETIKENRGLLKKPNLFLTTVIFNFLFIFIDLSYIFIFIPGVLLALFGNFLLVGPLLLIVAIMGLAINLGMHRIHIKNFKEENLIQRKEKFLTSFMFYALIYSFLIQFASVIGYFKMIFTKKREWLTK